METIGKYRIVGRMNLGGMRTLYQAYDAVARRPVALRIIFGADNLPEELWARLFGEAEAWARLDHPSIVKVFEVADHEGYLLLAMEPLEGDELADLIAERRPLGLEEKLSLMIELCQALHHAHARGVVHGHVNPRNILVLPNGQLKLVDFGLAWLTHADAGLSRTGSLMVAPRYMAPEQARGQLDPRADIFSVGTVFYELLAYRRAFDRDEPVEILDQLRWEDPPSLAEIDPTLPPSLIATVERALDKNPLRRFATLAEMQAALEFVRRRLADETLLATLAPHVMEIRALRAASRPEASVIDDARGSTQLTLVSQRATVARLARTSARESANRSGWGRPLVEWRAAAIAAGLLVAVGLGVGQLARLPQPAPPLLPALAQPSTLASYAAPGAIRAQMLAARDGAAQAKGPRLVPRLWASAADTQREAETALSQQDFDRAQALFVDAEKSYHEVWRTATARAAAREARVAGLRREARAAELAAETARRDAEQARAAWNADASLVLARESETEARAATGRQDYGLAGRRFRDAEREYQRVAVAARLVMAKQLAEDRVAALARPPLLAEAPRNVASPVFWAAVPSASDTR